jgi:ATP-dependent DNA helicase RecG
MLRIEELERLLVDLESHRVERKQSLSDPEKIRQALCAFANDLPATGLPGYLFVGVDDSGVPTGKPITDQNLLTLADMRSDGNILPPPRMNVDKVELHGASVIVVEVFPSAAPPVRFKGQVWVRVGPRRATATADEERVLSERSIANARTFDQRACPGARLDDLAIDSILNDYLPRAVARSVLAENHRTVEEKLAALRLFDLRRGEPTYAAILLFGKNPLEFVPGAYIQFVRFNGDTQVDPVQDQKELKGNLFTTLMQLDTLLPLQVRTALVQGPRLVAEERSDYPLIAVRELALNALLHRNYEHTSAPVRLNWFASKVEIHSPGGLYGQVTPQNFRSVSDYRNPVLGEAMKVLGYVERFGVGIARAEAALAGNGNPPAEFVIEPTHMLVTLRSTP